MTYATPSRTLKPLGTALLLAALPLLLWVWLTATDLFHLDTSTFLFLHSAAEMFAIVVAMLIYVTGSRSLEVQRNGPVVWLGVAFLGVGLLDGLHTLSYTGMPEALTPNTPHKHLIFWLAARLLAAMALLLYVLLPAGSDLTSRSKPVAVLFMLAFVALLGGAGLLWPERFPSLFIAGDGRTFVKTLLEWHVIAINVVTLGVIAYHARTGKRHDSPALTYALSLSAVSELFLTLPGAHTFDSSVVGHLYKVVGYMFLLRTTMDEALRRPLDELKVRHLRETATLTAAPDGVIWVNMDGEIAMANPAMEELTGYKPAELVGQNLTILLPPALRNSHARHLMNYFHAPHGRPMMGMDISICRRDGQLLPVDISLGHWNDARGPHAIAYIRDRREHHDLVKSLRHQATHDRLTGLPNRWLFQLELEHAMARTSRSGLKVGVLFLDLDHFKAANDTFGHSTGDALLMLAAQRMKSLLRGGDLLARMGGDEFAVLLPGLQQDSEAVHVAVKLLASLQEPFDLGAHQLLTSASIGIAFCPTDTSDRDAMLRYADMAMYRAKQSGRGTYACYAQEMDTSMHEDMLLHTRLKAALDEHSLSLHFQPQMDIRSGRIIGAEALLRWSDAVLGAISPARFVPIAETTGLIIPLSEWVLETACGQIAAWQNAGEPIPLAINISAQQLHWGDLAAKVRATLQRHGAQGRWLDIEITETMAMTQPDKALEQLRALAELGCSVSLDDFGTGYSSLAYLRNLPISKIKIDRSFVRGLTGEASDDVIVQTIIGMAHNLGLEVVAEGVETHAQQEHLLRYGCHAAQGFLWHKPMPGPEFYELMRRQPLLVGAGGDESRARYGSQIDLL